MSSHNSTLTLPDGSRSTLTATRDRLTFIAIDVAGTAVMVELGRTDVPPAEEPRQALELALVDELGGRDDTAYTHLMQHLNRHDEALDLLGWHSVEDAPDRHLTAL